MGFDKNPENLQRTDEQKKEDWEFTVKMCVIIKDLMNGNKNLPEGLRGRSGRSQRDSRGLPGSAPVDGLLPELRFPRGAAQYFVRLERSERAVHTCNRKRCS